MKKRPAPRILRGVLLAVSAWACYSCGEISNPGVTGAVVDTNGAPISDATVIMTLTGHTKARDLWFLAHSGLDHDHCARTMTRTDSNGRFVFPQITLNSYFGS